MTEIDNPQEIMTHKLKTWPPYFADIQSGLKDFELRRNDRPFRVNDVLILQEWDYTAGKYTGREVQRKIKYILNGGNFGLSDNYCILGLCDSLTAHVFTTEQLQERDRDIAGKAFDAAREMDYIDGGKVFDYVHPDKESYLKTIKEKLK